MSKGILIIIIMLIIVAGAFFFLQRGNEELTSNTSPGQTINNGNANSQESIVEITSSGYFPKDLTINAGDTVNWKNLASEPNWPASARHPSHEVYPRSSITKCSTSEESKIFDACKGIAQGNSYLFTFNEKGTWYYHDHLNPAFTGSITVQ